MKSDFVETDTGAFLQVACRDAATGAAMNLASSTAVLRYSLNGAAAIERAMIVVDAAAGLAQYQFTAGELVAGNLRCEVTVTSGAGTLTSEAPMLFSVRARIA